MNIVPIKHRVLGSRRVPISPCFIASLNVMNRYKRATRCLLCALLLILCTYQCNRCDELWSRFSVLIIINIVSNHKFKLILHDGQKKVCIVSGFDAIFGTNKCFTKVIALYRANSVQHTRLFPYSEYLCQTPHLPVGEQATCNTTITWLTLVKLFLVGVGGT